MQTKEKPDGTIRIVCIGHSTTNQATQNTKDTWSALLEAQLKKQLKNKNVSIEVLARSNGGERARHSLGWSLNNLIQYEPNIVILLEGINDISFNGGKDYVYDGLSLNKLKGQTPYEDIEGVSLEEIVLKCSQIGRRIRLSKVLLERYWMVKTGQAVDHK
jgi:lysophospholipase L1-like esterase